MECRTSDGETPLMTAITCQQVDSIRQLIKLGASVNSSSSNSDIAPLHLAAGVGRSDIVTMLLSAAADPHMLLSCGRPLHVAATGGNLSVIEQLLQHGADIDSRDIYGCTALHCAAQHGKAAVIQQLVSAGADVDLQQHEGATGVYLATYFGHTDIVDLLVSFGACLTLSDRNGHTALDIARQTDNWHLIQIIHEALNDGTEV